MSIINMYQCDKCGRIFHMHEKSFYVQHLKLHAKENIRTKRKNVVVTEVRKYFLDDEVISPVRLFNIDLFRMYLEYVYGRREDDEKVKNRFYESIPDFSSVEARYMTIDGHHILVYSRMNNFIPSKLMNMDKVRNSGRLMPGLPDEGEIYMALGEKAKSPIVVAFKNPSVKTLALMKMVG